MVCKAVRNQASYETAKARYFQAANTWAAPFQHTCQKLASSLWVLKDFYVGASYAKVALSRDSNLQLTCMKWTN